MNIKAIFIFSIFIDLFVIVISLLFKDMLFLLNTQIAYLSSSIVIFITYITYKNSITKNASMYTSSIASNKEVSNKEVKKIFQYKNLLSYISFYRIASYAMLSFSIVYMIDTQLFNAIGYMLGVSVVPFSIIFYSLFKYIFASKRF